MRNEWGEDRGEGNSDQKAPPLPVPLLHRLEEREKTVLPIGFETNSAAPSPARTVAGGKNIRTTLAFGIVAPLHAARTSQRDVPTTLTTYGCRPGPLTRRQRFMF